MPGPGAGSWVRIGPRPAPRAAVARVRAPAEHFPPTGVPGRGVAVPGAPTGVRTTTNPLIAPWARTGSAAKNVPPWKPAPPPPNLYSPERNIQLETAKRGLTQSEGELETAGSRDIQDYNEQLAEIGQREGYENVNNQRALQQLAESFARLGVRQTEGANRAGLINGGALLASAAARAGNEAKQRESEGIRHTRAIEALNLARAKLAREGAPPPNLGELLEPTNLAQGGRQFQDIGRKLREGRENTIALGANVAALNAYEAGKAGWPGPGKPPSVFGHEGTRVPKPAARPKGAPRRPAPRPRARRR